MREYWILTKIQLCSLFGINKILHMRNEEEKKQGKRSLTGLVVMSAALIYLSVLYSILLVDAFALFGETATLLSVMALAAVLLVLMFSIFETKGLLLGFSDYDVLMSWPVSVRAVAASRVSVMYLYNIVYAALFLLPAGIVFAVKTQPVWWFYPLYPILTLLLPALPTIVGAGVGTLVTAATARMKKSALGGSAIQIAFAVLIMFFSLRINSGMENIGQTAAKLRLSIATYCPSAGWFQTALTENPLYALLLLLVCAAALFLLVLLLGRKFIAINSALKAKPHSGRFVMRRQNRSDLLFALYRRESRRYFASSLYIANTAFGYIMLLACGVACVVKGADIRAFFEQQPELSMLRTVIPFALGWICAMSATTPSAISMEGKQLWIVKSLPVPARQWLLSKLLHNLTLAVPFILVSCTLIAVGLAASALETLWLFLFPLLYALLFGIFGLWLNIRMPKLDWQNDAEVVKQSAAMLISVFAGMGFAMLPGVLCVLFGTLILPIFAAAILLLCAILWRLLTKDCERRLYRL